ncbi:MAG TPA: adenylate/guanylate cyclase domain-containing protein, partial [Acidimicrobiia bacterium]
MPTSTGGFVALLFTDLVGSTALLDRLGDDAAEELRQVHFTLLRQAVDEAGGEEVKNLGDGLMVAFPSALAALHCAVRMQEVLAERRRPATEDSTTLAVRIGIHAGEPFHEGDDFFGTAVVVAKRLCDRAAGGQILTTELVTALVGSRGSFRFRPVGPLDLKGLAQPVPAVALDWQRAGAVEERQAAEPVESARAPTAPRGPRLVGRDREV